MDQFFVYNTGLQGNNLPRSQPEVSALFFRATAPASHQIRLLNIHSGLQSATSFWNCAVVLGEDFNQGKNLCLAVIHSALALVYLFGIFSISLCIALDSQCGKDS